MLDLVSPTIDTPTHKLVEGELVWIIPDRITGRTFATVRRQGKEFTGHISGIEEVMVGYNVTAKIAKEIEAGRKRHKICVHRKLGQVRKNERIHFFTARGTPSARHVGEFLCTGTFPIKIFRDCFEVEGDFVTNGTADQFAKSEGFLDWASFADWLEKTHDGLPVDCTIVTW